MTSLATNVAASQPLVAEERYPRLRRLTEFLFAAVPWSKSLTRITVRILLQTSFVNLWVKQRLFNFFAVKVVPTPLHRTRISVPRGKHLAVELNLQDSMAMWWYFWGYKGLYERATTKLFRRLIKADSIVVDVGANIGYYTYLAAALTKDGAVHSFEPNPEVFNSLRKTCQLNCCANVNLNESGVWDSDGIQQIYIPDADNLSNATLFPNFIRSQRTMPIKTTRLETYIESKHLPRIDLIKIDAEGAEPKVIKGLGKYLEMWKPNIICEVLHLAEKELDTLFQDTPYRKFLITDRGLLECKDIRSSYPFLDYFLTCSAPPKDLLVSS